MRSSETLLTPARLHGVTTEMITIDICTVVRTSDLHILTISTILVTPRSAITTTPMTLLVHKELFRASLQRTIGRGNDWNKYKILKYII